MLSSSLEANNEHSISTTLLIRICSRSRWWPWTKDAMQLRAKQAFLQQPESLACNMSISELICQKIYYKIHDQSFKDLNLTEKTLMT